MMYLVGFDIGRAYLEFAVSAKNEIQAIKKCKKFVSDEKIEEVRVRKI